jgi:hypothetical protein
VVITPSGTVYLGLDANGNRTGTSKNVTASESGWDGGFTEIDLCDYVLVKQSSATFTISQGTFTSGDTCNITINGAPGKSTTVKVVSTYTGVIVH